ncbi:MAG: superoxide dismutase family protein [Balneolaceae bacterium]|nr:superoxide dismutase family protein [Balneolaceae bacterium]
MKKLITLFTAIIIIGACAQPNVEEIIESPEFDHAVAVVHPKNGSDVTGMVHFEKTESGVLVKAEINGLTGTKHGFHIHQFGDCTADDGTSAGGHFNPNENMHAGPEAMDRHMGDLGNITAENGTALLEYVDDTINLEQIIGRGVIVHGGEDDLESQPSGAAGPRIGCGVIGIQEN